MTYDEGHAYFIQQADIELEFEEKKALEPTPSGISKIFACCLPRPKLATNRLVD